MGSKRTTLKTSREIHDRIRWDPSLDERAFVVAYEERFTGRQTRAFTEFPTDGEIPWHRVWEYRVDALVVWSREARTDLLFGSGDTPAPRLDEVRAAIADWQRRILPDAASYATATQGTLEALESWCHDAEACAWVAAPAGGREPLVRPRSLVVATLNVLFDRYDDGSLHTARRIPAMLELLAESGADLIALQEVTPRTLAALLAEPWVRRSYAVSDGPLAATVEPYGVVLLSRLPMRARLRRAPDGGHKHTVLATIELAQASLHVAVMHLTSDRRPDAAQRRSRELAGILRDLDELGPAPTLLLGDLNADDGPLDQTLHAAGFVDLWLALRPDEDGATFDPEANPLARLASRSGRPRRLDRIMLRAGERPHERPSKVIGTVGRRAQEGPGLQPLDIVRIGTRPTARDPEGRALPISDHFGLRARLRVEGGPLAGHRVPEFRPTHRSAVAIVPPHATWTAIQAIRREHDPAVSRWMPHVNLLYGFAPAAELGEAGRALAALVSEVPPFRVTLERFRWFRRRGGATVWLEPRCEPPAALSRLQAALVGGFEQCDEQSKKSPLGFVPHLTVGRLREPDIEATVARWQEQWTPISFVVDAVAVIHRGERDPFTVHGVVELGGGPFLAASHVVVPPELPAPVAALVGRIARAWGQLVEVDPHTRPVLHVAGSHRLGVAEPEADLDLVAVAPRGMLRAELLLRLAEQLRAQGTSVGARIVDGTAPRLALRVDGRDVDLQHVAWPEGSPWPTSIEMLAGAGELDAESRSAVCTLVDAEVLLEHAARHGGQERWREALRRLRRWAAARDVDDNALGYPGGLAWAVMLADAAYAVPCDPTDEDPARTLAEACLRMLAHRTADDWRRDPIAIGPVAEPRDRDAIASPMIVLAPGRSGLGDAWNGSQNSWNNCMRRASATTVRVLMAELARAVAGLDRGESLAQLSTPIDPEQAHPWRLVVELEAPAHDALDELEGFLRGRAAAFVHALERTLPESLALRPYALTRPTGDASGPVTARLVLGVDAPRPSPPSLAGAPLRELEQAVSAWAERPAGATVRSSLQPSERWRAG